ncbi:hypothetical protein G6F56_010365 [Rhizopus delemar]|nr:hypothetical protein G6F56_010365 [Rhizopus delemar]
MKFPWFLTLYYYLTDGSYPEDATKVQKQRVRRHAKKYEIRGEHIFEKLTGKQVLHEGNVREILLQVHKESHLGVRHLYTALKLRYNYHKKLYSSCREIVKECETCQKRARPTVSRQNLGRYMDTPSKPFYMVGCDAVGPMDVTSRGNRYMLTGIDYLTRWPVAMAVPDITEETTIKFYYQAIVVPHGVPNYIHTDRGSNFVSYFTKFFLQQVGCRSICTTAYRPQANGLCERLNQSLCRTIAKLARDKEERHEWDRYVNQALLVLRTLVNASTGHSPCQLLMGYQMVTPGLWQAPIQDFVEGEYEEDVAKRVYFVQEELVTIRKNARKLSDEAKERNAIRYNARVYERRFQVGEQVLLKENVLESKFGDKWTGPYVVGQVRANGTYLLEGIKSKRIQHAVNGDSLKPFVQSKFMIPDVVVSMANERFKTWVDARKNNPNSHSRRV